MIHENDGDYERDLAMREMDEWAAERAIDYADFSQDQQAEAELDR